MDRAQKFVEAMTKVHSLLEELEPLLDTESEYADSLDLVIVTLGALVVAIGEREQELLGEYIASFWAELGAPGQARNYRFC